jgi:protein-disulfide isomerase
LVPTVGIQMLIRDRQQTAAPAQVPARLAVEAIADRGLTLSIQEAPRLGSHEARIALIEFGDFECPFCRKHANTVLPHLKEKFIDPGIASYYYLHLPLSNLHPHATDAARAAQCVTSQGRFWDLHDLLFASEPTSLQPEPLRKLVASLRIDLEAFDTCVGGATERIASDLAQANRLGINATPAFVLGTISGDGTAALSTRINGARPFEVFAKAIEELRASNRLGPSRD